MDSAELLDILGNANRRRILQLLSHKPCYVTEISEYIGVSPKAVIDHLDRLESAGLVESRVDDQRRKYFHIARNLRLEVNVSPYQFGTKSAYPASGVDVTACRYVSIKTDFDDGSDRLDDGDGGGAASDAVAERGDDGAGTHDGDGATGTADVVADGADEAADTDADGPDEAANTDADGGDGVVDAGGSAHDDGGPDATRLARQLNQLQDLEAELSMAQRWVHGRLNEVMEELTGQFEGDDSRLFSDVLSVLATEAGTVEDVSRRVEAPPEVVDEVLRQLADDGVVVHTGQEWRLPD